MYVCTMDEDAREKEGLFKRILITFHLDGSFPTVQRTVPFTDSITEQNTNVRLIQIAIKFEPHDSPTIQKQLQYM